MALFFDQSWFDERLAAQGLTHAQVADALGIEVVDLAAVWKDQRELSAEEVKTLSEILQQDPRDIAKRAGISTPVPAETSLDFNELAKRVEGLQTRIAHLESEIRDLKSRS